MEHLPDRDHLMKKVLRGDTDAFVDLVENIRPELFDFLFRMSGQRDTVMRVIDESVVALNEESRSKLRTSDDIFVAIYATARSFCSHTWNADTSELINEGYNNLELTGPSPLPKKSDIEVAEKTLSRIPSWEREPILLHLRCGFSFDLVARIMSSSTKAVEEGFNGALLKLAQACHMGDPAVLVALVRHIPYFPSSQASVHHTMALSQLMGDIDKAKPPLLSGKTLMIIAVIVAAIVFGLIGWQR